MDSFEKELLKLEAERKKEKEIFLQKAVSKMNNDGDLCHYAFLLLICERFNLENKYGIPDIAFILTNYFIDNINEPYRDWVNKNNAPFVRRLDDMSHIFHEFTCITKNDAEIVALANKLYDLNLEICYDCGGHNHYVYAFEFDFNSFTPVNVDGLKELLNEISVLEKHGIDTQDLRVELEKYGFNDGELQLFE